MYKQTLWRTSRGCCSSSYLLFIWWEMMWKKVATEYCFSWRIHDFKKIYRKL